LTDFLYQYCTATKRRLEKKISSVFNTQKTREIQPNLNDSMNELDVVLLDWDSRFLNLMATRKSEPIQTFNQAREIPIENDEQNHVKELDVFVVDEEGK